MKKEWICSICGGNTMDVDMDYLAGYDHIACVLGKQVKKMDKIIKIENWGRCNGLTYEGYSLVNPIHSADYKTYYADVLNLNETTKPKLLFEMWYVYLMDDFILEIKDPSTQTTVRLQLEKHMLNDMKGFRMAYERLIKDLITQPKPYKAPVNPFANGIVNQVMSSGTTIKI